MPGQPRRLAPRALSTLAVAALAAGALGLAGCGPEEEKYVPKAGPSGKPASVPPVPTLPNKKKKEGDAYTVFGLSHDLNSRVHKEEVNGKKLSAVGVIVKTNLVACADDAKAIEQDCIPKCAIHKGGKEDPVDCKAPVPTFYIADEAGEKTALLPVMGWANNAAMIYDFIEELDKQPSLEKQKEVKVDDKMWGVKLPNPLPAVGMKVKVTGTFSAQFTKATGGTAQNPKYGILTYEEMQVLEDSAELANLPGMKERKPKK
jgi:hypothetical protein